MLSEALKNNYNITCEDHGYIWVEKIDDDSNKVTIGILNNVAFALIVKYRGYEIITPQFEESNFGKVVEIINKVKAAIDTLEGSQDG